MMEAIETGIGYDVILWFQSWRTDFVSGFFKVFDYIGTEAFFLLALPILYWCVNKAFGRRMMILFLASTWVNTLCKNWWKRPRPYHVSVAGKPEVIPAGLPQTSYGLPSGHTQAGTTFFGYLAVGAKKRWLTILFSILIVFMGVSRMVHGMHYPQDVLVGWTLGLLCLALMALLDKPVSRWAKSAPVWVVALVVTVIVAAALALFPLLNCNPKGLKDGTTVLAALWGGVLGALIEDRRIRFSAKGTPLKLILRFLLGIAGCGVIYLGLKPPFEMIINAIYSVENTDYLLWSLVLRFIRYSLVGLWITAGAPALFVGLKLADKE